MAGFLDQIDPLKQAALAELCAAPDLAALEQARVNCLGSHGKFTALMKQLGTLSKEEKPAAGITYSRFMEGLKAAKVALDRKILADLAATDAPTFAELVKVAQNALKTKAAKA